MSVRRERERNRENQRETERNRENVLHVLTPRDTHSLTLAFIRNCDLEADTELDISLNMSLDISYLMFHMAV